MQGSAAIRRPTVPRRPGAPLDLGPLELGFLEPALELEILRNLGRLRYSSRLSHGFFSQYLAALAAKDLKKVDKNRKQHEGNKFLFGPLIQTCRNI